MLLPVIIGNPVRAPDELFPVIIGKPRSIGRHLEQFATHTPDELLPVIIGNPRSILCVV